MSVAATLLHLMICAVPFFALSLVWPHTQLADYEQKIEKLRLLEERTFFYGELIKVKKGGGTRDCSSSLVSAALANVFA